ncbi:MAG TPA: twin-arginine translocase subunit TatB [Arenimonas sp.]|nr:MAG: twin arginine-targeting protein translocase TatB [Xanthomonadales bacterium GWF1_69_6]HBD19747.1 twin-arginine translocase subunit TatB [Arenimonas sp.]
MFDIGFSELLVIAVVALVVLGPERLPKAARFAGLWVRKARAQWYSVKSEFEREMAADEMRRSVGNPARDLREAVQDATRDLREAGQAIGGAVREAEAQAQDAPPAADTAEPAAPESPATPAPRQDPPAP